MPWYSGLVVVLLLFAGCATDNQPKIGKKVIPNEDKLIIQGLLQSETNLTKAINTFYTLYKKTDKYVYLQELIKLNFYDKHYYKTIQLSNSFVKKYPKEEEKVIIYKINAYIELQKYQTALKVAINYIQHHRDLEVYSRIAYIYIKTKDYKDAIKYLKTIYSINHDPQTLAQMGDIFFKYLKKPNEAISYYQTHIRLYGCQSLVCAKLAEVYRFLYDYDNLIEIYKKIYIRTGNLEYANKIVYLYLELGKYKEAIHFIKKNRLNESLLYLVYKTRLEKTKSYEDAYKLYKHTHKLNYFFDYSIYKFKQSPKGLLNLRNFVANLEFLVKKEPTNPLYLNYLGYVLIDYGINPKKGIFYVKQALKYRPTSKAFLDSLAWGYYKLHKCKKAYDIISSIKIDNRDIQKHKKLIRKCYDIRKNYKKNRRKSKKRDTHK